jgi:hypothetical protein
MNTVHDARITLTATIINNLAAAFAVAGFVSGMWTARVGSSSPSPSPESQLDYISLRAPSLRLLKR